jgi:hypothetical protein
MLRTQKPKLLRLPCPGFTFYFLYFFKKSLFIETFRTLVKLFPYSFAVWHSTSELQLCEISKITTTTKTKCGIKFHLTFWQPEWNKISPSNPSSVW